MWMESEDQKMHNSLESVDAGNHGTFEKIQN